MNYNLVNWCNLRNNNCNQNIIKARQKKCRFKKNEEENGLKIVDYYEIFSCEVQFNELI